MSDDEDPQFTLPQSTVDTVATLLLLPVLIGAGVLTYVTPYLVTGDARCLILTCKWWWLP